MRYHVFSCSNGKVFGVRRKCDLALRAWPLQVNIRAVTADVWGAVRTRVEPIELGAGLQSLSNLVGIRQTVAKCARVRKTSAAAE